MDFGGFFAQEKPALSTELAWRSDLYQFLNYNKLLRKKQQRSMFLAVIKHEENCIFLTSSFQKILKIWILVYWNYALYSRNFSFYVPLEYSSIPVFPFTFWGTFPTTSYGARSISESFPPPSVDIKARTWLH